jgi:hypothetical protein
MLTTRPPKPSRKVKVKKNPNECKIWTLGPWTALDCKGFKTSGYALITLVALQHLYEISLRAVFTFMGKVCVHSTKG